MHDEFDPTPVEEIILYPLDYPMYIEYALWTMFVCSFFWAFGIPVYTIAALILECYLIWLVFYGLWVQLSYDNLRYCQTGTYPNCTI